MGPWPVLGVVIPAGAPLVGVINGLIGEFARIDSFIATLGTGSVLYAITGWTTKGARIVPGSRKVFRPPSPAYPTPPGSWACPPPRSTPCSSSPWRSGSCLERLPVGRYLYVIGSNPRAADLIGIPTPRRYVVYAFVGSGLVTGFAGRPARR